MKRKTFNPSRKKSIDFETDESFINRAKEKEKNIHNNNTSQEESTPMKLGHSKSKKLFVIKKYKFFFI